MKKKSSRKSKSKSTDLTEKKSKEKEPEGPYVCTLDDIDRNPRRKKKKKNKKGQKANPFFQPPPIKSQNQELTDQVPNPYLKMEHQVHGGMMMQQQQFMQ